MARFDCSVCSFSTDSPLGMTAHSRKHRNRFEEIVGREPERYEEVRALLVEGEPPEDFEGEIGTPTTLSDFD